MTNNKLIYLFCALCADLLGCASEFSPDLTGLTTTDASDTEDPMETEDETGSDEETTGTEGSTSGDGDGDSGTGDGDPDPTTGDGDGDGDSMPVCGNGIAEGDEECDGLDLGTALSCTDLDFASGTLGCSEDCSWDISMCVVSDSNQQPEEGMWSECPLESIGDPCDWNDVTILCSQSPKSGSAFCTLKDCETNADCGPVPAGTDLQAVCTSQGCQLSCDDGGICPNGMSCTPTGTFGMLCG